MFNNKYSNILTMILVVLIVAILGIIGYFGYDIISSKAVNSNAQAALEEFEKATKKNVKRDTSNLSKNNTTNTADVVTPTNDPLAELDNLMAEQNTTTQPEEVSEDDIEKVYMEGYEVKGKIEIPKTKVNCPVLGKLAKRSLEIGTVIAYGPGLNEPGNTVIYGHNYRNDLFFSNNKKLAIGDKIYITDQRGNKITYEIYNMYETTPKDAEYMTRAVDEGVREISLQTCTDDSSGRIIIWAREKENG